MLLRNSSRCFNMLSQSERCVYAKRNAPIWWSSLLTCRTEALELVAKSNSKRAWCWQVQKGPKNLFDVDGWWILFVDKQTISLLSYLILFSNCWFINMHHQMVRHNSWSQDPWFSADSICGQAFYFAEFDSMLHAQFHCILAIPLILSYHSHVWCWWVFLVVARLSCELCFTVCSA